MNIYLIKHLIVFIVLVLSLKISAQETLKDINPGFMEMIQYAKTELKETDVGEKIELWNGQLKTHNIKFRMIFDEEGFVLMLKMISLGEKMSNPENTLSETDTGDIISFISAAERLGCEAPTGLREILVKRISNCSGKTWQECIRILKGN